MNRSGVFSLEEVVVADKRMRGSGGVEAVGNELFVKVAWWIWFVRVVGSVKEGVREWRFDDPDGACMRRSGTTA